MVGKQRHKNNIKDLFTKIGLFSILLNMVDKQRHLKFYELFVKNGWNGLLNVKGSTVCLSDYVKQSQNWNTKIDQIQSIVDFNTFVQTEAEKFAKWAIQQSGNREIEVVNINWFKGILGEYFYIENIEDLMKQIWSTDGNNYAFEHVVPASFYRLTKKTRLEFGEDFGTDAIGINRKDNTAIAQIKCWNIFSNKLITFGDIVSNMFMDGIVRGWIKPEQEESMFVLWLGKIKNISQPLNNMFCPAYGKVQYFGFDELQIIHQGYPRFFDNSNHFKMSLKNIANYKNYCEQCILNDIELI